MDRATSIGTDSAIGCKKKGAALSKKYINSFSSSYQEDFTVEQALVAIECIERLSPDHPIEINFYEQRKESGETRLYLQLIQYQTPIALSDILPRLENMDLRTYSQRPYRIKLNKNIIWISHFSVAYTQPIELKIAKIHDTFQDALIKINFGICENDGFNKLILGANLPWREVMILRGYTKYLQQIGFRFSQPYIEKACAHHPGIAKDLIQLFNLKFDPELKPSPAKIANLEKKDI